MWSRARRGFQPTLTCACGPLAQVTHACLLHALRKDPVARGLSINSGKLVTPILFWSMVFQPAQEVEEWLHSGVQENLQPNVGELRIGFSREPIAGFILVGLQQSFGC